MNTITYEAKFSRLHQHVAGRTLEPDDAPLLLAAHAHAAQRGPRSFAEDVCAHLLNGVVWSGPKSFALIRPVRTDFPPHALNDPGQVSRDPNCWWLYVFSGCWQDAIGHLPFYLPYIGWERRGIPRFHLTHTIVRAYDRNLRREGRGNAESDASAAGTQ